MSTPVNVNELKTMEAVRYYVSIGIITHPLHSHKAKVTSPGKQPMLPGWQKIQHPFNEKEINTKFSNEGNLGFLCGERSDLTVLDIDWYVKGIWDQILLDVDTSNWIKQSHTEEKYHFLFRYFNDIKAKTYPGLGFDVLSDTKRKDSKTGETHIVGNNCVAAPSIHPDGNKYQIIGNIEERPVIPKIVIDRIKNVMKTYKEITDKILPKCRRTFENLFDALFKDKNHELYHRTSIFRGDDEGRNRHLHLLAELKANGANDLHLTLICMLIFGDDYDPDKTKDQLQYIEALPAKTESILNDPILKNFFTVDEKFKEKKNNKLSNEGGIKKVKVYFNEAAKYILNDESTNIFTLTDNKQVYLYSYGVYKNEDTEAYLDTRIRDTHNKLFMEKWEEKNPKFPLPDLFPEASSGFVAETLAYIRAYTYELRKRIDGQAARYINLQNGLFDLEKWEKIDHTPDYLSISQIPVKYDTEAKCPQIKKFLREVANPKDIPFILEWFGYCLTTDVRYQKALMLYGIPGTGKSVLLSLLEMFIGTDNCSAESLQKIEEDKYRSANLYGKRLNVCNDIPSTKMHKTEVFKKLVSGLDTIDAEVKYQQPFKFRNIAKLAFSANKLPEGPKDPAFFERFVLIEFQNKFRGTDKDDKMLIHKLTTENELSGLLNLALKGLKRLYKKDKFSYKKTFEETEREYIINSNPVLFFMQECTVVSDKDIDATMLYIAYVDWSNKNKKPFVSKIEFSRRLNQIGYTSHRENLVKDGSKKATYWDNVQIKQIDENYKLDEKNNKDVRKNEGKSVFGQDLGQDRTSRSCPVFSSQVIAKSHSENAFGQDPFPFVVFEEKNEQNKCDNLEEVKQENNENEKSSANMSKRSCPCVCFFDSGEYGQDLESNMSEILSDDPNECLIDFSLGSDYPKNVEDFEILRRDLKNFARSHCNYVVESVPVFVGEFNSKYPGHKQRLGLQAVLSNAERLKERGWR